VKRRRKLGLYERLLNNSYTGMKPSLRVEVLDHPLLVYVLEKNIYLLFIDIDLTVPFSIKYFNDEMLLIVQISVHSSAREQNPAANTVTPALVRSVISQMIEFQHERKLEASAENSDTVSNGHAAGSSQSTSGRPAKAVNVFSGVSFLNGNNICYSTSVKLT